MPAAIQVRLAGILVASSLAACIQVKGSDFPAPQAGDGVSIDAATQTVGVDGTKVPVVPNCEEGFFVRRTATGWECASASTNEGPFGPGDLSPDAVTAGAIAAGAVGTSELADGAVTTSKLAPNAVALSSLAPEVRYAYLRADDASVLYLQRDQSTVTYLATEGGFTRVDDLYAVDTTNRVVNSSFELGDSGVPNAWERVGDGSGAVEAATEAVVDGRRALRVVDGDNQKLVAVRQVLGSETAGTIAAWRGLTVVASVSARRLAGSLRGQVCLVESATTRTCTTLGETTEFERVSVTHVVTDAATELSLVLDPGQAATDANDYDFDAAMVSAGPRALAAPPAWRPHPTEQIYSGGVRTESIADRAVTASKIDPTNLSADLLDGLDSAKFLRSDRDTATTGKLTAGSFQGGAAAFGAVSGTTGTFSGPVTGTTGTFSGPVSGTTGTFSGPVSAPSYGAVNGTTGTFSGPVSAPSYGAVNGTTGTFSGSVSAATTLSTRGGAVQRDVFTWNTGDGDSTPTLHLKTNWRTNNSAMYRIHLEGYNYSAAAAINSDCVGYLYERMDDLYNATCTNYAGGVALSQYRSRDGYLVIKVTAASFYYMGFTTHVMTLNPTGIYPATFTPVRQAANL